MKKRAVILAALGMLLTASPRAYAQGRSPAVPALGAVTAAAPQAAEQAATEAAVAPPPSPASVPAEAPTAKAPVPPSAREAPAAQDSSGIVALLAENSLAYEVDMAAYYLTEMTAAAAAGDAQAGQAAEACRNAAIDAGGAGERISFDELYLLARVIDSTAGSDWLTEDFRMCVGEVVLNRVASPEFPDTIHDVVYQKGQYSVVLTARFATLAPRRECVEAALRLLQGERRMVPSVVYQADYLQGELFSMYADRRLGNTYFCLSEHLELYPID